MAGHALVGCLGLLFLLPPPPGEAASTSGSLSEMVKIHASEWKELCSLVI